MKHAQRMSHALALPPDRATTLNEKNSAAKVARKTATTVSHNPALPNRRHDKLLSLIPAKC